MHSDGDHIDQCIIGFVIIKNLGAGMDIMI